MVASLADWRRLARGDLGRRARGTTASGDGEARRGGGKWERSGGEHARDSGLRYKTQEKHKSAISVLSRLLGEYIKHHNRLLDLKFVQQAQLSLGNQSLYFLLGVYGLRKDQHYPVQFKSLF